MAGATFSIGGVNFNALDNSQGRKALSCEVSAPAYQLIRFHIPGTDGNLIVRGGKTDRPIICHMRYIDEYPDAVSTFNTDAENWANAALTIVDEAGTSYTRCNLLTMKRTTKIQALGSGGHNYVFFDAMATFNQD